MSRPGSKERTASEAYLEVAAAHGVEYVFGLPGTSGQEFIGTIADQERLRFILALHETCVVSMADGYARVSGRPTLAQVSTLPGTANRTDLARAWRVAWPGKPRAASTPTTGGADGAYPFGVPSQQANGPQRQRSGSQPQPGACSPWGSFASLPVFALARAGRPPGGIGRLRP